MEFPHTHRRLRRRDEEYKLQNALRAVRVLVAVSIVSYNFFSSRRRVTRSHRQWITFVSPSDAQKFSEI